MKTVAEFEDILEKILMSEEEKTLFKLLYKEHKSLGYIADTLGMSESAVKTKHKKLLMKIGSYF